MKPFLCGMVVMSLLMVLCGAAMEPSGNVCFNTASLSINGNRIIQEGTNLKTASGADIPSIIQYTDSQGAITNYIPIRFLLESMGMEVTWQGFRNNIDVEVEGDAALYTMELDSAGTIYNGGQFEEVKPISPTKGKEILTTEYLAKDAFEKTLDLHEEDGDFVSVTVTNNGKYPLQFGLGQSMASAIVTNPTGAPAGQSVTRTIKINDWDSMKSGICVSIGNADYISRYLNITVDVIQFAQ